VATPRASSAALQPWLQALGAGGGTPLFAALEEARHWLLARGKRLPHEVQRCLVLTDGRLQHWAAQPCRATLLVDMELAPVRVGRAQQLAEQLQADYQHSSSSIPSIEWNNCDTMSHERKL
jgi:magnesium chelatase subunit ChlD-like protein